MQLLQLNKLLFTFLPTSLLVSSLDFIVDVWVVISALRGHCHGRWGSPIGRRVGQVLLVCFFKSLRHFEFSLRIVLSGMKVLAVNIFNVHASLFLVQSDLLREHLDMVGSAVSAEQAHLITILILVSSRRVSQLHEIDTILSLGQMLVTQIILMALWIIRCLLVGVSLLVLSAPLAQALVTTV